MAELYTPRTKLKLKKLTSAAQDGTLLPQVVADKQKQIISDFESRPKEQPPIQRQLPSRVNKKQRAKSADATSRGRARVASARERRPARHSSGRRPEVADAGRRVGVGAVLGLREHGCRRGRRHR